MSDIPISPSNSQDDERRRRLELERAAAEHLSRLNGALELQAAVLALLVPRGSQRAKRAWQAETEATPNAAALREHVNQLSGTARLPWFETLVLRMRGQSLASRQTLLASTRRIMGARGVVRPIDRLHWLAMRQWLGEGSAAAARVPAAVDLSRLPQNEVSAIATFSAFLARMVPRLAEAADEVDATRPSPGVVWYDAVMAPWQPHATIEPCRVPDTDGVVHALQELQALAWMQRPMLLRGWVTAAQRHSRSGRFTDSAADALRLTASLLDSPMPPELAHHYGADAPQPRT